MEALIQGDKFKCAACTPVKKTANGCERDSPIPGRWEIAGESFQRCPLKLVTIQTWRMIGLYQQYKLGFLPVSGGIFDQSSIFWQAMEVIEGVKNEHVHNDK